MIKSCSAFFVGKCLRMRIQWGKRKQLPRVMCAIQDHDSHVTWHPCAWERTCDMASVCRSKGYTYYRSEMTSWTVLKQIEKTPLSIMFTLFDIGCRCSFAFLTATEKRQEIRILYPRTPSERSVVCFCAHSDAYGVSHAPLGGFA